MLSVYQNPEISRRIKTFHDLIIFSMPRLLRSHLNPDYATASLTHDLTHQSTFD